MKLFSGVFPVHIMNGVCILVGLGTDGAVSNVNMSILREGAVGNRGATNLPVRKIF